MTLVQLRHFLALADSGSFRRAAARVFLTQPALSRSIQSLEDEWGAPLFDRLGRRIELTPFGRAALPRARRLLEDAEELQAGAQGRQAGTLRVGMGSGAGAMLMTPLLMHAAQSEGGFQVEIARGRTDLLVQALRDHTLDALVVDARSLKPEPDLQASFLHEMSAAFMVRPGHPLLRTRGRRGRPAKDSSADLRSASMACKATMRGAQPLRFDDLAPYPLASTPLSDEVARLLVQRYGPQANPLQCVALRCEELTSLAEVALHSDAVLLAIRGAGAGLVELVLDPPLEATARFGLVTLAGRTEHPGVAVVRELMDRQMV